MSVERHHFVPKIYFREFTKDLEGFFFRATPKPYRKESILHKHINNVGYLGNFYTLKDLDSFSELNTNDPNYIEKNAFKYENTLVEILAPFKNRETLVDATRVGLFIEVILSIKHRNPFFRESFVKEYNNKETMAQTLTKQSQSLKEVLLRETNWPETQIDNSIQRTIASIINDVNLPDVSYKKMILENSKEQGTPLSEVKERLMEMRILVYEPRDPNSYFITSDNPGFTLVGDRVYNTEYGKFDAVGFPINSKQVVLFINTPREMLHERRTVSYSLVTNEQVDLVNSCTIFNSYESIFCEDRLYLEGIIDRFTMAVADKLITSKP